MPLLKADVCWRHTAETIAAKMGAQVASAGTGREQGLSVLLLWDR